MNNYEAFNKAKLVLFDFIEEWYNNIGIYSSIRYIFPDQKYENYLEELD